MSVVELLKPHLPLIVRRPLAAAASYLRGRRVINTYSEHYRAARRAYRQSGTATSRLPSKGCGVRVLSPDDARRFAGGELDYSASVRAIADAAREQFGCTSRVTFFPRIADATVPERTANIPAVQDGDVIIMRLREPCALPGLVPLSRAIVAQLEHSLFGAFAIVDRAFVYRSPPSRQRPRASWLWHYDNYPREVVKVMIYLTDVTDACAPFEYLEHETTGEAMRGRPLSPGYGDGRFSEAQVAAFHARGYRSVRVTGAAGTMLIFDTNVVHRATLAEGGHRDVLVLQVRPALVAGHGQVDERWTGSFPHTGFNADPADVALRLDEHHSVR